MDITLFALSAPEGKPPDCDCFMQQWSAGADYKQLLQERVSDHHRINEKIYSESKMDNGSFPVQNLIKPDVHRKPEKEKWLNIH